VVGTNVHERYVRVTTTPRSAEKWDGADYTFG
jgi:hypothetical protein